MGNTNYSSLKRIFLLQTFMETMSIISIIKKPMNITHGKTTHLVGLTKPKQAYLQSPAGSSQPTHKSQQLENT